MERTDIQIITQKGSVTIHTEKNQITFALSGEKKKDVAVFSTAEFPMPILDLLEKSKIVLVGQYTYKNGSAGLRLIKRYGYTSEKLQELLLNIVEKFNL